MRALWRMACDAWPATVPGLCKYLCSPGYAYMTCFSLSGRAQGTPWHWLPRRGHQVNCSHVLPHIVLRDCFACRASLRASLVTSLGPISSPATMLKHHILPALCTAALGLQVVVQPTSPPVKSSGHTQHDRRILQRLVSSVPHATARVLATCRVKKSISVE